MDRTEYEDEQETLKGIAATLFALAVFADLLCVVPLPHPLRVLILSSFRRAEAVVRAYAVEWAGGAVALPLPLVRGVNSDSHAEALRLARSFRALASVVGGLQGFATGLPLFRGGPHRHLAPAMDWRNNFMRARRAMAFHAAPCADTS